MVGEVGGEARGASGVDMVPRAAVEALKLTARQREVLVMLCDGLTCRQVGAALGISAKTVETHRARIQLQLGIKSLPMLVRWAIRAQVIAA